MKAILLFYSLWGTVTKPVSVNYKFWSEMSAEAESNKGPSTYQPNALPLRQTGVITSHRFFRYSSVALSWRDGDVRVQVIRCSCSDRLWLSRREGDCMVMCKWPAATLLTLIVCGCLGERLTVHVQVTHRYCSDRLWLSRREGDCSCVSHMFPLSFFWSSVVEHHGVWGCASYLLFCCCCCCLRFNLGVTLD